MAGEGELWPPTDLRTTAPWQQFGTGLKVRVARNTLKTRASKNRRLVPVSAGCPCFLQILVGPEGRTTSEKT